MGEGAERPESRPDGGHWGVLHQDPHREGTTEQGGLDLGQAGCTGDSWFYEWRLRLEISLLY